MKNFDRYLLFIIMMVCLLVSLVSCEPETVTPTPPYLFKVERIDGYIYVDYDQSPKMGWKLYKAPTEEEVQNPDLANPHLSIITGNGTGCTALKSTAYWWYRCHRVVSNDGEIDATICLK